MSNILVNTGSSLRFKTPEFHYFNWLYGIAPCFPVHGSKINIISDPKTFYDKLCERFRIANRRISIASLYVGTGVLEQKLLKITKTNLMRNKNLKLNVLLDYQRGTRGKVNSKSLLQELVDETPDQCNVSLYQTPRLQGLWSKALPSRYNELVGLQHMKLYIADNTVMLSGANCSNDYFHRRQDRYIEIENVDLADYYCELIDEVSGFSKTCAKNGIIYDNFTREEMILEAQIKVFNLIQKWKLRQESQLTSLSNNNDSEKDTWVFPLVQMGEFKVDQDERATRGLLASAPKGSYFKLATGYFNLTEQYAKTLLKDCKANVSLLMAHPNANGFLGAAGPAGGIPFAYSLIAKKFWQRVQESNQGSRIRMMEYERQGWTFHAKGLWYYPPKSAVPWMTLIGSANLGERSVKRDLEAQAAIFTVSPQLQEKLHQECCKLHNYATDCTEELLERRTPLWVRATVGLFRTYF